MTHRTFGSSGPYRSCQTTTALGHELDQRHSRAWTKNKRWTEAINKALKQYNEGEVKAGHALDVIALKLVRKAVTTNDDAVFNNTINIIGDRIEGKTTQSVMVGSDPVNPLALVIKEISGFTIEPDND